jgi:hypothetical protein
MTTAVLNSRFVTRYEPDFRRWVEFLAERHGPIVAISRKAPRLLELLHREGIASSDLLSRVVSEHALPFMGSYADDLIVVDDSVIHGSTFRSVIEMARGIQKNLGNSSRVTGAPFAVGTRAAETCREVLDAYFMSLADEETSAFVNGEVYAFRLLGMPYDVEHPTSSVRSPMIGSTPTRELLLQRFAAALGGHLVSVDHIVPMEGEHVASAQGWTLLLKSGDDLGTLGTMSFAKLRIYLDPCDEERLTFASIRPLPFSFAGLPQWLRALPPNLYKAWWTAQQAVSENANGDLRRLADRRLVIFANHLGESALLGHAREVFEDVAGSREKLHWEPARALDVRLLLGPVLCNEVLGYISEPHGPPTVPDVIPASVHADVGSLIDPLDILPNDYAADYEALRRDLIAPATSPTEALRAIFQAQHIAIEKASRISGVADTTRLEFGLTIGTLLSQVRSVISSATDAEIHRALDALIDTGCVVPRYIRRRVAGREIWVRMFRVGEGSNSPTIHAIQCAYNQLSESLPARDGIPATLLEKFCVLAFTQSIADSRLTPFASLEITKDFYLYGARAVVTRARNKPFLVDWATSHKVLRRVRDPIGEMAGEAEVRYALYGRIPRIHPPDDSPWGSEELEALQDLAQFMGIVARTPGLRTDAAVVITSAATRRELHRAVQTELSLWLDDDRASIHDLLYALSEASDVDGAARKEALDRLEHVFARNANFLTQAISKRTLYDRRGDFFRQIDDAVRNDRSAQRIWRKIKQGIDNRRSLEEKNPGFDDTFLTIRCAYALSSLIHAAAGMGRAPGLFSVVSTAADELRRSVEAAVAGSRVFAALAEPLGTGQGPLLDSVPSGLTLAGLSFASVSAAIQPAALRLADVCQRVLDTHPLDFANAPYEVLEPPRYIATWDLRSSGEIKDQEARNRALEEANYKIQQVLGQRDIKAFVPASRDDGNGLIAHSLGDILTCFAILDEVITSMGFTFRMGCDVNVQGGLRLFKGRHRNRLSLEADAYGGRAYEFAARMMSLFKELRADESRWNGEAVPEEPQTSYLVLSEFAKRYGEARSRTPWPPNDIVVQKPNGTYTPRVLTSIPVDVYLVRSGPTLSTADLELVVAPTVSGAPPIG